MRNKNLRDVLPHPSVARIGPLRNSIRVQQSGVHALKALEALS